MEFSVQAAGRGELPGWMAEKMKAGANRDDLLSGGTVTSRRKKRSKKRVRGAAKRKTAKATVKTKSKRPRVKAKAKLPRTTRRKRPPAAEMRPSLSANATSTENASE